MKLPDNIARRIRLTDTCWVWLGAVNTWGYGHLSSRHTRNTLARRVVYEALVGPIPEGLQLDHLCRNKLCVNPAHLEPVTRKENILRGTAPSAKHARKTLCPKGHPYRERRDSRNQRICLICKRENWHRWKRRKEAV